MATNPKIHHGERPYMLFSCPVRLLMGPNEGRASRLYVVSSKPALPLRRVSNSRASFDDTLQSSPIRVDHRTDTSFSAKSQKASIIRIGNESRKKVPGCPTEGSSLPSTAWAAMAVIACWS